MVIFVRETPRQKYWWKGSRRSEWKRKRTIHSQQEYSSHSGLNGIAKLRAAGPLRCRGPWQGTSIYLLQVHSPSVPASQQTDSGMYHLSRCRRLRQPCQSDFLDTCNWHCLPVGAINSHSPTSFVSVTIFLRRPLMNSKYQPDRSKASKLHQLNFQSLLIS